MRRSPIEYLNPLDSVLPTTSTARRQHPTSTGRRLSKAPVAICTWIQAVSRIAVVDRERVYIRFHVSLERVCTLQSMMRPQVFRMGPDVRVTTART